MTISVQELIEELNLEPIDLSKLDETRGLYFENAILTQAKRVDLSGCVFYRCCLVGADFDQSNRVFIDCIKRKTISALSIKEICEFGKTSLLSLSGLNLSGANLQGANLQGANLEYADLRGANLQGANLQGADLDSADLESANLQGANLVRANLYCANLQGANLQGANLQRANLEDASYNSNTKGLTEGQKRIMVYVD